MKAIHLAAAFVLFAAPAGAQNINLLNDRAPKTADEVAKEKAVEDAYKAKMNKIPDQKTSSDPWATVRTPPPAQGSTPARRTN